MKYTNMYMHFFSILLIAVAISWSCVDANPMPKALSKRMFSRMTRSAEDELSTESEEKLVKQFMVGLLLIAADKSAEEEVLSERFKEALDQKWDSLDDFSKHVVGIYEEVTGEKSSLSSESDESE